MPLLKPAYPRLNGNRPLARDLTCGFPFSNKSGAFADITKRYTAMLTSPSQWTIGRAGSCLYFNGSQGLTITPGVNFFNNAGSVSFWLKRDGAQGGYANIISNSSGTVGVWFRSTNVLDFYFGGDHLTTTIFADQTWYFCTLTIDDSGNWTLYTNGLLDVSGSGISLSVLRPFTSMGADNGSAGTGETFKGWIDDLKIWNGRCLAASSVWSLYHDSFGIYRQRRVRRLSSVSAPSGRTAALASTLGDVTAADTAILLIHAALAVTLGDLTAAETGVLPLHGTVTATLGDVTAVDTGILPLHGAFAVALGDVTAADTGILPLHGAFAVALGDVTAADTGILPIHAALAVTFGDVMIAAAGAGSTSIHAVLAVALGDVIGTEASILPVHAALVVTLGDAAATLAGVLPIRSSLTATLADVTGTETGVLPIRDPLIVILDSVNVVALGSLRISAALSTTLGNTMLSTIKSPLRVSIAAESLGFAGLMSDNLLMSAVSLESLEAAS